MNFTYPSSVKLVYLRLLLISACTSENDSLPFAIMKKITWNALSATLLIEWWRNQAVGWWERFIPRSYLKNKEKYVHVDMNGKSCFTNTQILS